MGFKIAAGAYLNVPSNKRKINTSFDSVSFAGGL